MVHRQIGIGDERIQRLLAIQTGRDLSIDDGVQKQGAVLGASRQHRSRPSQPSRVAREDVDQDVAVDERHGSKGRVFGGVAAGHLHELVGRDAADGTSLRPGPG